MEAHFNNQKPELILFDVNETLLDLKPVAKKVNKLLDSKKGFKIWFGLLLQYALVDNNTGTYHDFTTIAKAALDMASIMLDQPVSEEEKTGTLQLMKQLPPHTDVEESLNILKDAGFRLAAFSNSPYHILNGQLQYAGITPYLDGIISVDEFKMYKPNSQVYRQAIEKLEGNVKTTLMIAAHGWDIAGALSAGMQAGFISRKGQALYPLAPKPKFNGSSLVDVANQIVAAYS